MIDDIVAYQFKVGIADEVLYINLAAGKKIIETDNVMSLSDESFAEVGTEESGAAGNKDTHNNTLKPKKQKLKRKIAEASRQLVKD